MSIIHAATAAALKSERIQLSRHWSETPAVLDLIRKDDTRSEEINYLRKTRDPIQSHALRMIIRSRANRAESPRDHKAFEVIERPSSVTRCKFSPFEHPSSCRPSRFATQRYMRL
jgi:hypothetical protein